MQDLKNKIIHDYDLDSFKVLYTDNNYKRKLFFEMIHRKQNPKCNKLI